MISEGRVSIIVLLLKYKGSIGTTFFALLFAYLFIFEL